MFCCIGHALVSFSVLQHLELGHGMLQIRLGSQQLLFGHALPRRPQVVAANSVTVCPSSPPPSTALSRVFALTRAVFPVCRSVLPSSDSAGSAAVSLCWRLLRDRYGSPLGPAWSPRRHCRSSGSTLRILPFELCFELLLEPFRRGCVVLDDIQPGHFGLNDDLTDDPALD